MQRGLELTTVFVLLDFGFNYQILFQDFSQGCRIIQHILLKTSFAPVINKFIFFKLVVKFETNIPLEQPF